MSGTPVPIFVTAGANEARVFGLPADEWMRRLAANAGFECSDAPVAGRPALIALMRFAWDPAWLKAMRSRPGAVLTMGGEPVIAHVSDGADAALVAAEMEAGSGASLQALEQVPAETTELSYSELRKRERPFVRHLDPADPERVELSAYNASYKGVTDALTLYLWRGLAFHLTRWAAKAGLSPNMITSVGFLLCLLAFWLFWNGNYWLGLAAGFTFMVLDTVDGKLARCTGQSSKWGNIFDHGVDLIHPPFWYWGWAHGLEQYGRPIEPVYETMLLWAIVIGYVLQRVIEGLFIRRFGMHIHVWERIDSQFRLITARRNPNMAILVVAMLFGRPDVGLELVALWTILSLFFHAVRLAQATALADRGRPVRSWIA